MWLFTRDEAQGVLTLSGLLNGVSGLADFEDAGRFYNWRLFLPLCKTSGVGMNRVGASEPLTALVIHCHLPVMLLPPSVFLK
jgi:hypothetical protein